ncbi:hypothetical protein TcasGA2_TC032925 [Tribolium castaneum]|uniref:Uncharacterized protein n=1 Tax=Tribolium castaneum TaxID=7070 RepID=A0A139WJM4_TRICA|nr:hypothetical protein TcasGA2_TC032925 [Tribolium castaneum]
MSMQYRVQGVDPVRSSSAPTENPPVNAASVESSVVRIQPSRRFTTCELLAR